MNTRIDTALLAATAAWCAAILLAAVFNWTPLYAFFSLICHQKPERSWHLLGAQLPVCIRCTSIYFGFLLALLLKHQPEPGRLKAAIAVTLVEVVLAFFVIDSVLARSLSGLFLGAAAAPFVRVGVQEMLGGESHAV